VFEYAWLIILLPLAGFLVAGLLGKFLGKHVGWVAVGTIGGAFVVALYLLVEVLQRGAVGGSFAAPPVAGIEWVPGIRIDLLLDNLSVFMLALVSLLSTLIALYSIGYMAEEEGKPRYFAEICLFVAGMLGTVSADNFLQLLIFWEIMGLCSYLLIGFWYHKPEAASAAKKAFLVTRIGDVLFLFGVIAIYIVFGSLKFSDIQAGIAAKFGTPALDARMMTLIPLLLFGGAVGKSAQFPLHVWLPDAMEGPTPVSALIHAATMVKAGVYLVARSFIFLVPVHDVAGTTEVFTAAVPWNAILVIGIIGGFTAFFAATMAVANHDIKRVLAFSTISQLAYMFLGLAAGAWLMASTSPEETGGYSAALFHLTNHAFFKALLFLAAGSVIHAVHTNDMREMGGLRKHMPITSMTMLLGCLALAGIPPFSGFWSKDEILGVTFAMGASQSLFYALYALGILTAFLTAFYTFRLWFLTFSGSFRGHHEEHVHESPGVMTGPLAFLAVFTVASGLFTFLLPGSWSNLIYYHAPLDGSPLAAFTHMPGAALAGLSIAVAVGGLGLAYLVYYRRTIPAERFTRSPAGASVDRLLLNRYGIDGAYDKFAQYGVMGVAGAADWFDRHVIDGAVNGAARVGLALGNVSDRFDRTVIDGAVNAFSLSTVRSSLTLRQRQTGSVQNYAGVVVLGLSVVILLVFIWRFVLPALGVK